MLATLYRPTLTDANDDDDRMEPLYKSLHYINVLKTKVSMAKSSVLELDWNPINYFLDRQRVL